MIEMSLIAPRTMSGDEIESLWSKLRDQDYFFDDLRRGRSDLFVIELFKPNNLHFYVGQYGMISLKEIVPGHSAEVHFTFWEKPPLIDMYKAAKKWFGELFNAPLNLNRLTVCVPSHNLEAQHVATMLGFVPEGRLRKYTLHQGELYDLLLYGLLRKEFHSPEEVH